ncbi:hypothetical protein CMUS01_02358 [Colletotrichum musicola]|uniref:Uncharacterized protein n=1 Tax=Colletotrichum musicola TaxID=2175873 RepID=A0A8H6NV25_9PEZI|nr:hypothetical protein CMUS01_02358 [Colletotrichum musicola]
MSSGVMNYRVGVLELKNTKELVHPSVRVRYLYNGLGLDDEGEWQCKALTGREWELIFEKTPPKEDDIRPGRNPRIVDEYKTDHERRLRDHQLVLPEEHISVWERMYIEINEDIFRWQGMSANERKKRWSRGDKIRDLATEAVSYAFGTVNRVVKTTVSMVFSGPPAKYLLKGYPREHGYHDIVSWQRGIDATSRSAKRHSAISYDSYDGYNSDSGDHRHNKGSWN